MEKQWICLVNMWLLQELNNLYGYYVLFLVHIYIYVDIYIYILYMFLF